MDGCWQLDPNELLVTRGDVIGFLAYNFTTLVFQNEGQKEDLWLSESTSPYVDSLFMPVVNWKPTPVGRESHTTADCDTGAIIFEEPYKRELLMQG